MTYDLILRGGRVVDPSQKLDAVTDVAFSQGKVARVGPGLPADAGTDVSARPGTAIAASAATWVLLSIELSLRLLPIPRNRTGYATPLATPPGTYSEGIQK